MVQGPESEEEEMWAHVCAHTQTRYTCHVKMEAERHFRKPGNTRDGWQHQKWGRHGADFRQKPQEELTQQMP